MWRGGIEHWKFKAKIQAVNYTVENAKTRPPVLLRTLHYHKAFPQYFMLFLFFLVLFSSARPSNTVTCPIFMDAYTEIWIHMSSFLVWLEADQDRGEMGKSAGFMWDAGS